MYYTKYRPQKFSELSQPNDVAKALSTQIKNDNTVHAYLFVGSRGTGKTTMARLLAKALNCTKLSIDGDPCGKCDNCLAIQNGSYLDLIEIDAASNRGIDDIRELKEKIKLAPSLGICKVYIIDEVHMLTPEAFNALLKTLEEPPAHVTFVLCTTEFHKVPETIRSRCQVYKFKRATLSQLTARLDKIAKAEKATVDEATLKMIASASQGGFRDAETLLQQIVEGEIDAESLVSMGSREAYVLFSSYLISMNAQEALHKIDKLNEDGVDLYVWVGELLKYLRDLVYVQAGSLDYILDDTDEVKKLIAEQANSIDPVGLARIINTVLEAHSKIKNTIITQLPMEIAIVEICNRGCARVEDSVVDQSPVLPQSPKIDSKNTSKKTSVSEKSVSISEEGNSSSVEEVSVSVKETVVEVSSSGSATISIETVTAQWKTIVSEVSSINHTISALLKSSQIAGIDGNIVLLEVPFDFHKERLQAEKTKKIVEDTISSLLQQKLRIKCTVKKMPKPKFASKETGKLTDYNIVVPSGGTELNESVLDVFDGGLPF